MLQEKFIPDDDLPTYLQKMADTGTYGDHICLEKLANILECKIRVVHADTQDVFIGNKEDTLLLGFIPELQHYTSLEFRLKILFSDRFSCISFKLNYIQYIS